MFSSSPHTADHAIAGLYTAAADSDQWDTALAAVARVADGRAAACFVHDAVTEQLIEQRLIGFDDPTWADSYARYYHALDPARQVLYREPAGRMYPMHRFVPEDLIRRSEYYQDFYFPVGMRYSCGGTLFDGGKRLILAVHRPTGHRLYDDETVAALQRILEHLPNVFRVRDLAARTREGALLSVAALEALQRPVAIVDSRSQIRYLNPAAQALLNELPALRVHAGQLSMREPRLESQLALRVKAACRPTPIVHPAPLYTVDTNGRPVVEVNVVPLPPQSADRIVSAQPMAMVLIRRVFPSLAWPRNTERPYGLSPAEMALALALVEGLTPAEHAARTGVKLSTVRSHIRSVFAKTGTRRAAEVATIFAALEPPAQRG